MYTGVVKESQKWIRPVRANQPLREAFLAYVHPPNSHQKLRTLSQYVIIFHIHPPSLSLFSPPLPSFPLFFLFSCSSLSSSLSLLPSLLPPFFSLILPSLKASHSTSQLQESGSALRTGNMAPPNILPALESITTTMSTDLEHKLNETTSLVVISEACLGIYTL